MNGTDTLGMILYLAIAVVALLWVALPFAVFGIKDQLKEMNETLKKIAEGDR